MGGGTQKVTHTRLSFSTTCALAENRAATAVRVGHSALTSSATGETAASLNLSDWMMAVSRCRSEQTASGSACGACSAAPSDSTTGATTRWVHLTAASAGRLEMT